MARGLGTQSGPGQSPGGGTTGAKPPPPPEAHEI